jgi:hypothetical protein
LSKNKTGFWTSTSLVVGNMISARAFIYSLWEISGSGEQAVYSGFLFLIAGMPVDIGLAWTSIKPQNN